MKNLKKSAFSLIELSIVVLVIRILIAGVTQSSRLIRQMKLASARSLTESSPVSSISGLVLWLETTSERAFSQELEDADYLPNGTKWLDRNPQSSLKGDAVTLTSQKAPIYLDSCINDLPCLSFDAADQRSMDVTQGLGSSDALTTFIVFKAPSVISTTKAVLLNTNNAEGAGNGWFQIASYDPGYSNYHSYSSYYFGNGNAYTLETIFLEINTSYILEVAQSIKASLLVGVRSSGGGGDLMERPDLNNGLNIGYHNNTDYLDGFISEIIIFDRYLKREEKVSVENYLAKKWGIKI